MKTAIVALCLGGFLLGSARAELSLDRSTQGTVSGIVRMQALSGGGGGDPDPWRAIRLTIDPDLMLNVDGGSGPHPDSDPAFGINPVTRAPEAVWSHFDGSDYELAYSGWIGNAWSTIVLLTSDGRDQLDPVLSFASDGTARIAFSVDGEVMSMSRPLNGAWTTPEYVDSGIKPSRAATLQDRVALQRRTGSITEVVAAVRMPTWSSVTIAGTSYLGSSGTGDIDLRLHDNGGKTWIDWEESSSALGWSRLDQQTGQWSAPQFEPIASAADEEAGRLRISRQISP